VGLRAIKEKGREAFVQRLDSASFDDV